MGLRAADAALRANKDFVISCLRADGLSLRHASADLRADQDVVRVALEQDSRALRFADERIRAARGVVGEAVRRDAGALEYACLALRRDRELVLEAVRRDGAALRHAGKDLRGDREVVLAAIAECGLAVEHARSALRDDREVVLEAVGRHGGALHFASAELRRDPEVCCLACRGEPTALEAVDGDDPELRRAAQLAVLQGAAERLRVPWAGERAREEGVRSLRDEAEKRARGLLERLDAKGGKKTRVAPQPKEPSAPPLQDARLAARVDAWADQVAEGGALYRKLEGLRSQNMEKIAATGRFDFGDPWERPAPRRLPLAPAPGAVLAPSMSGAAAQPHAQQQQQQQLQQTTVYRGPDPSAVKQHLLGKVQDLVAGEEVDADTPLMDVGIDSIASVELRASLQKDFQGVQLPSTLMFNYPTITAMTEYIVDEVAAYDVRN